MPSLCPSASSLSDYIAGTVMAQHFIKICCDLNTFLQTMKGCHLQLHSFQSCTGFSLPAHTDWCVCTRSSIVSHHLGKNIIAKCLAREQQQKQKPGFEDRKEKGICAKLAQQQNTLRWYTVRSWCPSCPVQLLCKPNVHCLYTISGAYWKTCESSL